MLTYPFRDGERELEMTFVPTFACLRVSSRIIC